MTSTHQNYQPIWMYAMTPQTAPSNQQLLGDSSRWSYVNLNDDQAATSSVNGPNNEWDWTEKAAPVVSQKRPDVVMGSNIPPIMEFHPVLPPESKSPLLRENGHVAILRDVPVMEPVQPVYEDCGPSIPEPVSANDKPEMIPTSSGSGATNEWKWMENLAPVVSQKRPDVVMGSKIPIMEFHPTLPTDPQSGLLQENGPQVPEQMTIFEDVPAVEPVWPVYEENDPAVPEQTTISKDISEVEPVQAVYEANGPFIHEPVTANDQMEMTPTSSGNGRTNGWDLMENFAPVVSQKSPDVVVGSKIPIMEFQSVFLPGLQSPLLHENGPAVPEQMTILRDVPVGEAVRPVYEQNGPSIPEPVTGNDKPEVTPVENEIPHIRAVTENLMSQENGQLTPVENIILPTRAVPENVMSQGNGQLTPVENVAVPENIVSQENGEFTQVQNVIRPITAVPEDGMEENGQLTPVESDNQPRTVDVVEINESTQNGPQRKELESAVTHSNKNRQIGHSLDQHAFESRMNQSHSKSITDDSRPIEMTNQKTKRKATSIRDRYRRVRQQYPEVLNRLERHRATTPAKLEWDTPPHVAKQRASLLLTTAASPPGDSTAQSSVLNSPRSDVKTHNHSHANSTPIEGPSGVGVKDIVPEMSAIALDQSVDLAPPLVLDPSIVKNRNRTTSLVDDDGDMRRGRFRPPSRTESEYGEDQYGHRRNRRYDDRYYHNRNGRRRHTAGYYTPVADYYMQFDPYHQSDTRQRPKSAALPQMRQHYSYDFDNRDDYSDQSESDDSYEGSISGDRIGYREAAMERSLREQSLYYFGSIGLPGQFVTVRPPHPEYSTLAPIERAAYMYHYSLYRRFISDVRQFQKMFKYQHVRLVFEKKMNDEDALREITRQMRADYQRIMEQKNATSIARRAYEASQRQLFSDERESPDFIAEGKLLKTTDDDIDDDLISFFEEPGLVMKHDEKESDRSFDQMSDQISVESTQPREPLKHRVPHALVKFGAGGHLISVLSLPGGKPSVMLEIRGVKDLVRDETLLRLLELMESFRGPLVGGQTATHSVLLYIRRTIQQMHAVADQDCLLIWRLLQLTVQQQGRVCGPDLALLLLDGYDHSKCMYNNININTSIQNPHMEFRSLLLGGHIKEALDFAQRNQLWAEALFLAQKLGDNRVFDKFVSCYSSADPLRTLYQVLSGQTPTVSVERSDDADYSWRAHAAVLLANGAQTQQALTSIYQLGINLAANGRQFACDFCLLTVHLLAGWNVFVPVQGVDGNVTRHIQLIHATPNDWTNDERCEIYDLHATEIYDFAVSLFSGQLSLPSVEYQSRKFSYALRLAELGMAEEAFGYTEIIGANLLCRLEQIPTYLVNGVRDLANGLRSFAIVGQDLSWIDRLQVGLAPVQAAAEPDLQELPQPAEPAQQRQSVDYGPPAPSVDYAPAAPSMDCGPPALSVDYAPPAPPVPRYRNLSEESDAWHGDRTEPIQMIMHDKEQYDDRRERSTESSVQSSAMSTPIRHNLLNNSEMAAYYTPAAQSLSHQTVSPSDSVFEHDSYNREEDQTPKPIPFSEPPISYTPDVRPPQFEIGPPQQPSMPEPPPPRKEIETRSFANIPPPMLSASSPQAQSTPNTEILKQPPSLKDSTPKTANTSKGSATSFLATLARKVLPRGPNEMILPDDRNPAIWYNEKTGKYEGAGIAEDKVEGPPPMTAGDQQLETKGLQATRISGGSRYFNAMASSSSMPDAQVLGPSSKSGETVPITAIPTPLASSLFGFIPAPPIENGVGDGGSDFNPFSVGEPVENSKPRSRNASESSKQ